MPNSQPLQGKPRHLEVLQDGQWKPFCRCNPFDIPEKDYHGWPTVFEAICMEGIGAFGTLDEMKKTIETKYKLTARIVNEVCPILLED